MSEDLCLAGNSPDSLADEAEHLSKVTWRLWRWTAHPITPIYILTSAIPLEGPEWLGITSCASVAAFPGAGRQSTRGLGAPIAVHPSGVQPQPPGLYYSSKRRCRQIKQIPLAAARSVQDRRLVQRTRSLDYRDPNQGVWV